MRLTFAARVVDVVEFLRAGAFFLFGNAKSELIRWICRLRRLFIDIGAARMNCRRCFRTDIIVDGHARRNARFLIGRMHGRFVDLRNRSHDGLSHDGVVVIE